MPKKKQVTFQNSIQGKFIPRNTPPATSVFPSGANDNRLNAKMAELLASSSIVNDENELVLKKSPQNDSITVIDSSRVHSKLFHRRIVNMLDTLRKSNTSTLTTNHHEFKSQPITFGQLRQATISSGPKTVIQDKNQKNLISFVRDSSPDLTAVTRNEEQLYYSSSFEQHNVASATEEEEREEKSLLTDDEILAMYYSKIKSTTNNESHLQYSTYSNTSMGFYVRPSLPSPPRLLLNEQNRNRLPPPSYSSTVTHDHRSTSTAPRPAQPIIRPLNHFHSGSSIRGSSSSPFPPTTLNPVNKNSISRPPPPYHSPTPHADRSHPTVLSTNDSSTSIQQSKTITTNNSQAGFDREFSRLLYGKSRRLKQKRKASSDPVKKSVEEARRTINKAHRRRTTHLTNTDEDDDDDDDGTNELHTHRRQSNPLPQQYSKRQSDNESSKKAIIPANPLLKRRIPSFLRVYSQASSFNDILLQWYLFNLSELESFSGMMTRLYKNENLARVQLYELYRTALISILASKTSSSSLNTNEKNNAIAAL